MPPGLGTHIGWRSNKEGGNKEIKKLCRGRCRPVPWEKGFFMHTCYRTGGLQVGPYKSEEQPGVRPTRWNQILVKCWCFPILSLLFHPFIPFSFVYPLHLLFFHSFLSHLNHGTMSTQGPPACAPVGAQGRALVDRAGPGGE